jgi:hypothetical protein
MSGPGSSIEARVQLGWRARFQTDAWLVIFGLALALSAFWIAGFYLWRDPGYLFVDAHVYFRATEAWLHGANPWTTTFRDVPFAGIPPTLLLNIPLLPFGETAAVVFWTLINTASIAFLVRRLRLPIWVVLLQPVLEGWLAGTPDLSLAALVVLGAGWLAALTKPYSAPVLIAERNVRQLAVAAVAAVLTIPILPWTQFIESRAIVADSFARFAGHPVSAVGEPVLMVATAIALISLGWRRGWTLSLPGLLAQQPHYNVFALDTVVRSRILSLAMTIPLSHAAAIGIVVYSAAEAIRRSATHGAPGPVPVVTT